jgi:hypothetical protein
MKTYLENGFRKLQNFVKRNANKVKVALGIGTGAAVASSGSVAHAQSSVTALPFDPSFLYTSITTPTNAALIVGLGFAALFFVIRKIRKALGQ